MPPRDLRRFRVAGDAAVGARHDGNAELLRRALGLDLVAHQADMLGLGADELHAVIAEDFGKAGVLRQKPVAGMHRIGAGDLASREDGGDIEIAVLAPRGGPMHTLSSAKRTCMASASAVECTATVGMPSSLQARSTRRAISPRLAMRIFSNIASARPKRRHSMIISGSPNSTGWPSSNRICITVPARGAGIWFMVFIASMISSVSPLFDARCRSRRTAWRPAPATR